MTRTLALRLSIVAALLLAARCSDGPTSGTETTNGNAVGVVYDFDGAPAPGATVKLVPVGADPRAAASVTATVVTGQDGRYSVSNLAAASYNVLADKQGRRGLVDSAVVHDSGVDTLPDAHLAATGSLAGVVKLMGEPVGASVYLLVLGTTSYASADTSGRFALANMAGGSYRVRVLTTVTGYGPKDTVLSVRSGFADTLGDTIRINSSVIPVPTGVRIQYDTMMQIVTLSWRRCDTALVRSYNVYRRNVDSNTVLTRINASPVVDTAYVDSTGVQDRTYEYHVAAVDNNAAEGTKSAADSVKVVSGFALADSIGTKGSSDNQLFMPRSARSTRSLYVVLDVVDPYPSAVKAKLFDLNGSFIRSFTVRQNSSAEYLYQLNSAIDSQNNIYVAFKDTTYEYDTSGSLLATYPLTVPDFETPITFLQARDSVRIYSIDRTNQEVVVRNLSGGVILTFGISIVSSAVGSITADPNGNLYVVDNVSMRIYKYDPGGNLTASWGSAGGGFGKFGSIQGIVADNAGRLYVNDEVNSQVQIFSNGTFVGRFSTFFNTKKWQGTANDNSEPVSLFLNTDSSLGILEGNVYNEIHVFRILDSVILP